MTSRWWTRRLMGAARWMRWRGRGPTEDPKDLLTNREREILLLVARGQASLLTIRPKQKSAALRAGYSNVAQAALSARLLLSARSGSDRSVSTMPVPWERRSALTERRRPAHRQLE